MFLLYEFCKLYKNDQTINLTIIGDGDLYAEANKSIQILIINLYRVFK